MVDIERVGSAGAGPETSGQAGDDRDERGDVRDHTAEAGDERASARDDKAHARDGNAEARDGTLDRLAAGAASDRAEALGDRRESAIDRAHAAADREAASADRALSAGERAASSIDALTQAHRRDAGIVELQREATRARRTGKPYVLAFVDVDGLKATNDSLGHAAGDQVLRHIAETIRAHLRAYDLIVRFGGDEFVCGLPDLTVEQAAERFRLVNAALAATVQPSITVGLAELEEHETLEQLIARADDALYGARRQEPSTR